MDIQQVIKFYGGEVKTAAALGKSIQTIISWKKSDSPLSYWNQAAIQTISNGKLKAKAI